MLNAGDYERMKLKIEEGVLNTFYDFIRENECEEFFCEPEVAYFDAKSDIFDKLSDKGISESMKRIYRAGKTLICFTIPYSVKVIKGGDDIWALAYGLSIHLLMKLNSSIKSSLKLWGRVTSSLNTPMDWDFKKPGERWSHKTAGVVCGLGRLTSAGVFIDNKGRIARVSGVVTDCNIVSRYEEDTDLLLKKVLDIDIQDEEIKNCPAGAISKDGIDKFACQKFCMKINDIVPSADVCAKCVR